MRPALFILFLCAPALPAADPEPKDPKAPKPREIAAAGLRLEDRPGRVSDPAKVDSAEALAKFIPDREWQARLKKQVDLKREYLLVFAWAGSGGDRLGFKVERGKKGPEAVFTHTPGLTDDLRRHVKLFALPKRMTYRVVK
jgi:hypothetical protein